MILTLGPAETTGIGAPGRWFFKGRQGVRDVQAQVRPEEAAETMVPGRGGPGGNTGEPARFNGLSVVLAHLSPVLRKDLVGEGI